MLSNEDLIEMYEKMVLLRQAEEKLVEQSSKGKVWTLLAGVGQEAIPVGTVKALGPEDYWEISHRGTSDAAARDGVDLKRLFAEVHGRKTGYSKGKGGNMHIEAFEAKVLPMLSIVGESIPVSAGVALAQKMKNTGGATVCFFGDGASNQGVFHEGLNLATIWKLPVVYLVQNNQYAVSTPVSYSVSVKNISERAKGYGIPGVTIDGNDVLAVYEAVSEALKRAKEGEGPTLIEAITYRWYGHHAGAGADEQMGWIYRPEEEVEEWKKRDPIANFEKKLTAQGLLTEEKIKEIWDKVNKQVEEAVEFAESSPFPDPDDAFTDVYTDLVLP